MITTYYETLVKQVMNAAIKIDFEQFFQKEAGVPSVFVPGHGELYNQQPKGKRVIYIGKDTNGWYDLRSDIENYKNGNGEDVIKEIIQRASKGLKDNKHVTEWGGKGPSQYWDFILKMQAKILGVTDRYSNEVTQSFAWGNSWVLQTLNLKDEVKKHPEYERYKELCNIANMGKEKRNEVLEAMIKMFKPDIIIILNWNEYTTFLGEDAKEIANSKVLGCDNHIKWEVHQLKNGNKVLWTYHPRAMTFRGGVDAWVEELWKNMIKLNIIDLF